MVLVVAPKGQGLTSLLYAILRGHDAFLEHIHTVERGPDIDLEGITQNKLPAQRQPGGRIQADRLGDQPGARHHHDQQRRRPADRHVRWRHLRRPEHNRRVYVGMQAASTFDALAEWRKLVGDDKVAVEEPAADHQRPGAPQAVQRLQDRLHA